MNAWQWPLEIVLIGLLAMTLFYALRLERSLNLLRRDRENLGEVLASIGLALDDAERGIQALRQAAELSGRALAREVEAAAEAKRDMQFLLERVESVAAKVETAIRAGRVAVAEEPPPPKPASKAERDLLKVLRMTR